MNEKLEAVSLQSLQSEKALKRKATSGQNNSKMRKYNSVIEFINVSKFNGESAEELKNLLKSGLDIDDHDKNEDCTPLLYCVIEQKLSWIPFLLEHGASPSLTLIIMPNELIGSASDVAWRNGDDDIVCQLIMADGMYPRNFGWEQLTSEQREKLKNWSEKIKKFHGHIKNGQIEAVKDFVANHPKIKYAYNSQNKCALLAALESNNAEIYRYLQSKAFAVNKMEKKSVNNEITKHFTSPNLMQKVVSVLVLKSRLGPNNDQKHFEDVENCFKILSKVNEMKVILQLVADSLDVTITFDYESDSISAIDPANTVEGAVGRTYGGRNKIFIAAKRDSKFGLLGTLAQELAHFALYKTFKNDYLPFRAGDLQKLEKYQAVVTHCCELQVKDEIIGKVYQNLIYDPSMIQAELIVRVPQLLVLHRDNYEKLAKLKKTFKSLFEFYEDSVLPDLNKNADLIEPKQKARELNTKYGQFEFYSKSKRRCKSQTDKLTEINQKISQNVFVRTKTPKIAMASLVANLIEIGRKDIDSNNIFVDIAELRASIHSKNLQSVLDSKLKWTIYVLDSNDFDTSKCKLVFDQFFNEPGTRIVFVTSKSYEDFENNFPSSFNITFRWDDLTDDAKSEIMELKYILQGKEVQLKDIFSEDSKNLRISSVVEILNFIKSTPDVISKFLPDLMHKTSLQVFIERRFETLNRQKKPLQTSEVLQELELQRCVILADSAGMGKTTSAIQFSKTLKEQNPFSWVMFIDLKQHIPFFQEYDQQQISEMKPEIFSQLLKLKDFEKKLLDEFINNSKVIFIIDGIDEISPSFKNLALNMTRLIKRTENLLLVTTRMHLAGDLETKLGKTAIKLQPFSPSDQVDFLKRFWKKKFPEKAINVLERKSNELLKKFQGIFIHHNFVEVPLQLYMMAEVFENTDVTDSQMNLFSLYQQFVEKKVSIWNGKGRFAKNDNTKIQTSKFNVFSMHQKMAIEEIFGKDVAKNLNFPEFDPKNFTDDLIMRMGLIRKALNGSIEFQHKTFAEFVIADYCYEVITNEQSSCNADMFLKIFLERDYENIRKFLNDKIEMVEGGRQNGISWTELASQLNQEKNLFFFGHLVADKLINLAVFVLQTKNIADDTKLKLVKFSNKYFRSALHIAMDNFGIFKALWNCVESFTSAKQQKELLLADIGTENNILMRASYSQDEDVLKSVLEAMQKLLNNKEFIEMVSQKEEEGEAILVEGAKVKDSSTFEIFWTAIEKKLEVKEQQALLFFENKGLLAYFSGSAKLTKFVLETIEKPLTGSEFYHFLKRDDWVILVLGFFAYQAEVATFSIFWSFIERHFKDTKSQGELLTRRWIQFNPIKNALSSSCCNSDYSTRKFIFNIAREVLTLGQLRNDLTSPDHSLLVAFHHSMIFGNAQSFIKDFESDFGTKLDRKAIRDLLMQPFSEERNIFHVFCNCSAVHDITWEFILEHLETHEILAMLLQTDVKGKNVYIWAAEHNRLFLMTILELAKEVFSDKQKLKELFYKTNNHLCALLHLMAFHSKKKLCEKFFHFLNSEFEDDELKDMVLAKNKLGELPFTCLLRCEDTTIIEIFWSLYARVLSPEKLADVVENVNKHISQHTKDQKDAAEVLKKICSDYTNQGLFEIEIFQNSSPATSSSSSGEDSD